ncbi:sulfotransferase family protein [Streptomyces sp. NPDC004327]|uniref:sulfotransferase family protein n=1 Tax=Streptomyces sp. NPDC004327 TaxID=3364699 RepID=UPI00369FF4A5
MPSPFAEHEHLARLTPEKIIDAAGIEIGGSGQERSHDTEHILPALRQLTSALQSEARITVSGAAAVGKALTDQLVTRSRVNELIRRNPEIAQQQIPGPVFITGIFRSGTTLLQNLMAEIPSVRAPRLWEMLAPAAAAAGGPERSAAVKAAEEYVAEYYEKAPLFKAIHPLDAHRPEECHRLTGGTFRADIYALRYRVPSYVAWLREQDMRPSYAYHRTLLGCLLRAEPAEHVVLKCPSHMWHLNTLAQVYPQARIVRLHRDPKACLPSLCSLTGVVRGARSGEVDKREIGAYWAGHVGRALAGTRPAEALESGLPVLDLRYSDLVSDPVGTVARVCRFAGIAWSPAAEDRVRGFLAGNPKDKHGKHSYSAEEFGLDPRELDERFAAYRRAFDL